MNWFSYYGLRDYLAARSFDCLDRFDLIDPTSKGALARNVIGAVRAVPPLRWLGHVATSYTVITGRKRVRTPIG